MLNCFHFSGCLVQFSLEKQYTLSLKWDTSSVTGQAGLTCQQKNGFFVFGGQTVLQTVNCVYIASYCICLHSPDWDYI